MEDFEDIREICNKIPYWRYLGLEIECLKKGFSRLVLRPNNNLVNTRGTIHGGVISSLIDSGAGTALRTVLLASQVHTTIELNVSYLASTVEGNIFAEGSVIRCGKSIAVASVDVKDYRGNLMATGRVIFLLRMTD